MKHRNINGLPELLAPAGDFDCLISAVKGGADAVYVGGKLFGARAYAKNFDTEELKRAVEYCHLHGVKLYVTVNTLLNDAELGEALLFARDLYGMGVDAIISADIGFITEVKRLLPNMEIHASTQMSVHNTAGADFAYDLGCSRVVLARECSGRDIATVTERCKAQTEVFLHGALCVCHSGQCLFSSLVGGRSGNRGECAQPCRLPYNNGKYALSLKDLSLADHIRELIDSGVASLKIEGRMKSPSYVYTVTKIYRKLLDEGRGATEEEKRILADVFSRGGFTDGYFVGNTKKNMLGVRSEADKESSRTVVTEQPTIDRVRVGARVTLRLGQNATMELYGIDGGRTVTVTAEPPERAISAPLDADEVKQRLSKMGNTFLSLAPEDIELHMDEEVNMPLSRLNALRRSAAEAYQSTVRENSDFVGEITPKCKLNIDKKRIKTAIFYNADAYNKVKNNDKFVGYFDIEFLPLGSISDSHTLPSGVAMPPVIMESEVAEVREMLNLLAERGVKYALVSNVSHLSLAKEAGLIPMGDMRLNITNSRSAEYFSRLMSGGYTVSAELTAPQARDLGGSAIVYGRIPLMITEKCFMREHFGCDRCGKCALTDRKGMKFPMIREYKHRTLILNSAVTYMADRAEERKKLGGEQYIFTTESAEEIIEVVKDFRNCSARANVRRMGRRA